MQMVRALWAYRGFIKESIRNEFRGRYVNSVLGGGWAILEPLALILVFTVVFSQIMNTRLPGAEGRWSYSIFLCAGVLPWNYFLEVLTRSQNMFLEQSSLIRKLQFPKSTIPTIVLGSATVHFVITMVLLGIFLVVVGHNPGWAVLWMVPLLLVQQCLAVGIGLICGTLNVFFRDIGKLVGVISLFWFWLTPIVYPIDIIPQQFRDWLLILNPMAPLVLGYQEILLHGELTGGLRSILPQAILAAFTLGIGFFTFTRLEGALVDEL